MEAEQKSALTHFHVCAQCGHRVRREEVEGRALSIGIVTCPTCGHAGPLNVQIGSIDGTTSLPQKKGPKRA